MWVQLHSLTHLAQARLSHKEGGLGLVDIRPQSKGLVIVGRRALLGDNAKEVRFAYAEKQRIEVHTYDYLLETLEGALNFSGPSGLNPYLIQPWRDGDGKQPGAALEHGVPDEVETDDPQLNFGSLSPQEFKEENSSVTV